MAKKTEIIVESASENSEPVRLLGFSKSEGWYVMDEYEIPKHILEKHGKRIGKTNPDIFAIFKEHVINKIRDYYGL